MRKSAISIFYRKNTGLPKFVSYEKNNGLRREKKQKMAEKSLFFVIVSAGSVSERILPFPRRNGRNSSFPRL
jgi:hypothetical protein